MLATIALLLITWHGPPTVLSGWFESLSSPGGGYCCAQADGRDTDYTTRDGHYVVPIDGVATIVPSDRVIKAPNLHGSAMVWLDPQHKIRCFIPGAGS